MNPSWLPGIIGGLGLVVNAIWTTLNLQMRSDMRAELAKQTEGLKQFMSEEYVSDRMCKLRHEHDRVGV